MKRTAGSDPSRTPSAPPGNLAERISRTERDRTIQQLGKVAGTLGGNPRKAFQVFWNYLIATGRDFSNPSEKQAGLNEWRTKCELVENKIEYPKLLSEALGEDAKRFGHPLAAQKFGRVVRDEHGKDPTDPLVLKFCLPKFRDQNFRACQQTMRRAFGQDFRTNFPNVAAQKNFHKYMCANNLHAASSEQELRDLYEKFAPGSASRSDAAEKPRALRERALSKPIGEQARGSEPRRKPDLRDELQKIRGRDAAR